MTRRDAELLFAWIIATYGDPSKSSTSKTFVERNAYYQRETKAERNSKGRMCRDKHRAHDDGYDERADSTDQRNTF